VQDQVNQVVGQVTGTPTPGGGGTDTSNPVQGAVNTVTGTATGAVNTVTGITKSLLGN